MLTQWYLTRCDPHGLLASLSMGFTQARILEWVAISCSRGSSWPRDWTWVSCIVDRFFRTAPPGKQMFYVNPFHSVQSLSHVRLFATPWTAFATPGTAAHQASLSIINSQSLLKLMSIESVMPSSHLILCHPLLPLSIFPSIRVFSNVSSSHQVAKVLEFQLQHQSFQWTPRTDFL